MNNVDRAKMIHLLSGELEDSVTNYQTACDKRGSNFAMAGLDVSYSDSRGAIKRKIIHLRQALLDLEERI